MTNTTDEAKIEAGPVPEVAIPAAHARALRLRDAAPEMLAALKGALEYWAHRQQRYKNRRPAWVRAAEEAIAKAGGRS